ncbi:MAG TPA: cytochrome c [Solirubrobacterales bacterium]|jgi:mono/diheme cytochrome c family protein|nr:cytochrome c [Solirubrobacterales bacterium]
MRGIVISLAIALIAVAISACGGGGSSSSGSTASRESEASIEVTRHATPIPPTRSGPGAESEEGNVADESPSSESGGQAVFTSTCAACHTLKAAGAEGTVGPNLDELMPEKALVEHQVINGGGGMPPFKGVLSDEQVKEVAEYVSTEAGK